LVAGRRSGHPVRNNASMAARIELHLKWLGERKLSAALLARAIQL
jgi:hypothetical protein